MEEAESVVEYLVEKCQAVIITQDKDSPTPITDAEQQDYAYIAHYLKAQLKAQVMKMTKMVMESDMLPFYKGVRGIIVKYLQ